MAEYVLTTPTPVAVGASVPFNSTIVKCGCSVIHREGSGVVNLKGGSCCNPRRYHVSFHGNVTGVAGAIQLGLFLDGELLPETLMSVVPVAATDVWSVTAETEVYTNICCENISVRVITGDTVTVNTAALIVEREV